MHCILASVNHDRSWPLHPLSLILTLVVLASLSLVNLYPRVHWGSINYYYLINDELSHGWPLVYMQRDSRIANADMGGMYHGAWPFENNPGPIRQFRIDFLILDVIVALILTCLTIAPIESLLQARKVQTQFSLGSMLTITAIACLVFAIQRVIPLHLFALHVVPNCVVMLSSTCACLFIGAGVDQCLVAQAARE
jgi:hypothetical protein